jgi:peptidoglycan/xylan/chitin deacetylase (PgdA/CDA1 family)
VLPWRYPGWLTRILLPGAIFRADPSGDRIYLTYDDGPDPEVTPALLDILEQFEARVTFFVLTSKEDWWGDLLREIAGRGHQIALHGAEHRSGYRRPNSKLEGELRDSLGQIQEAGVEAARAYRPPFGHIRPDTVRFLKSRGFQTVLWSKIPGDFRRQDADRLFARAVHRLRPGDIMVLHDGTNLRPPPVLELTRRLLEEFRRRGWRSAPLNLYDSI